MKTSIRYYGSQLYPVSRTGPVQALVRISHKGLLISAMTIGILFSLTKMEFILEWVCNLFSSDFIVFNEKRIASTIAGFFTDASCKWVQRPRKRTCSCSFTLSDSTNNELHCTGFPLGPENLEKMGRHFPVREKSGNFEQTGKVREKSHKILEKLWEFEINII